MTGEASKLLPDTDYLLDKDKAAMGTVLTAYNGQDPLTSPPAFGYPESMQVEIERRMVLEGDRTRKMNDGVFLNPDSGWGPIKKFMDGVFEQYKSQNDSALIKKPRNEEEAVAQMQQMRPVQVDPNEVASMRQLAVKLDQQMKAIDPRTSFWTDPRTKNYADWLNRESGQGTAGFMQSGEQPVELGAIGRTAYSAWQGIEGIASGSTAIVHGLWDLGRKSINAMGGPDIGASYPTNFIETEDGQLVSNGGKAPSMLDGIVMAWSFAANENIEKHAAAAGRAQEWELANRAGLAGITTSVSRLGGELVGMAPGFGAAAKAGEATLGMLTQKGLQALGTLRLAKGAQQSERALKIIGAMSKGMGQASGMAAYESVTQGRVEGYGASYLHGLMMAPVLMTLGALGKKTEWFASNRAGMPGAAARAIGGALEGAGFGAVETTIPELLPSAWGFIRDPNQSTFEAYAKNMLAFSMVKMSTGNTAVASPEQMQIRRGVGRSGFAEKVARGEAGPEEIAKAPVVEPGKLQELGQASMQSREGKTVEERTSAQMRQREIERELDVAEFGQKPPAEKAVENYLVHDTTHVPKDSRSITEIKNEFKELQTKAEKTPADRKRMIELMDLALDRAKSDVPKSMVAIADNMRKNYDEGVELSREILDAGDTVEALISRKSVTDIRAARTKKLAEMGIVLPERPELVAQRNKETTGGTPGQDPEIAAMAKKLGMTYEEMAREMGEDVPAADVNVERPRETSQEDLLEVRRAAQPEGTEVLPDVSRNSDALMAGEEPAAGRGATSGERAELRQGLPPQGEAAARAVRGERLPGDRGDASPGLQQAAAGDVAVQGASPGGTPARLEARQGDMRSAAGERQGAQSLQVQPTRQVEATPGTKPVQARDIYTEMEGRPGSKGFRIPFTSVRVGGEAPDKVRVAMRGGSVEGRNVAGVFKTFENLVRTAEGRDLAVAAHEWSHAMQRHTTAGGAAFQPAAKAQLAEALKFDPRIGQEVAEVLKDYPGAAQLPDAVKWMETWAEWHARNLLGEVGLDAKLPAISGFMRAWLASPAQAKVRDQYGRIQEMLHRYNAQGALGRLEQSIVSEAAPLTETQKATRPGLLRRAFSALNKSMLDDMSDLKRSQERWLEAAGRRPEDVSISEDPARMFDALRMTSDKTVEHYVNSGIRLPSGEKIPGLKGIMESVKGREKDFQNMVVAVRSLELYRKGKEVQLPVQDYVESIKQLTMRNPDFAEQINNLKRWTDALVDYVAGAGSISAEDAAKVKDAYAVYVPFFRAIQGPAQHGQGRGVAERGTGLSHIEGSTYEIRDPFIALQQVARSMVGKAHQNQVMASLYKMAHGQEAGGMATVVQRTNVPTTHPLRRLLDAIEQQGALPKDADGDVPDVFGEMFDALRTMDAVNPQTVTTFAQKIIPTGERNIIAFTPRLSDREIADLVAQGAHKKTLQEQNGKLQWLEVDTKVYEALMGIDKMPQLPEAMQPVMQWLQAPRDVVRFFATGVAPGFVAANLVRDAMSAPLFDRAGKFRPFGGFVKLIRGAIEYHKNGEMRELYEELGVKTSSFWTEGRQRSLIGEEISLWQKARAMADTVQNWFSHPENYIRMAEFKDSYQAAKAAGKSEFDARLEALEAGREITVNFARAGIWSRVLNQTIPYFNAGLQGQRKLWGQLIAGGADTKGDEAKARVQRGAILNGLANLTVPATLLWLLNKDEEWYQDLPEWRKVGYFNMKLGGEIVSVPKPFEAGTVFASIPEIFLDHTFGKNPASAKAAMRSLVGPYLEVGSLIPAFLKPLAEVAFNQNFFTGRPLTPEWIQKSTPAQEQATFYTTETAKVLSRALNGILSPTEIEALAGGYTAGAATKAMRLMDEVTGLKDHPGVMMNPLQRFTSQEEHGQSSFVDQLYSLGADLEQREDSLSTQEAGLKRRVDSAKRQISDLRKRYQAGSITKQDAEKRSYEIARPLVERSQR